MINPFEKRATEFLRDNEAFLSVVTPEPLEAFFAKPAKEGRLYDRLVMVIGSPGSGKTTLATLLQYQVIAALLRNSDTPARRPLEAALTSCGAIQNGEPQILGVRLPLESGYREFWEFPYSDDLRNRLMASLLQARAVLGWLRNLEQSGADLGNVSFRFKAGSQAAVDAAGGATISELQRKAIEVEKAVYSVSAALIPPDESRIPAEATQPYRPFDVIEAVQIVDPSSGTVAELKPLIILDDAHVLHEHQFAFLRTWLAGRELAVARWLASRTDALTPAEVLTEDDSAVPLSEHAPPTEGRDITRINFQSLKSRGQVRPQFRKMALDMASRYLRHLPVFERKRIVELRDFLVNEAPQLTPSQLSELRADVEKLIRNNKVSAARAEVFRHEARAYARGSTSDDVGEDVQLAIVRILVHRYLKRIPQSDMFAGQDNPEPSKPLRVNAPMADGARIFLLHKFKRPYYYGSDMVCDASDENAERFLRLAGQLVAHAETRLTRNKSPSLSTREQHKWLVERANEIVKGWAFPEAAHVRMLTDKIAEECLAHIRSEPNAPLGGGPNAIGIPSEEFRHMVQRDPRIARVLQYGVGYSALNVVPDQKVKNELWYLVELSGAVKLVHGLSLHRGNFLERRASDIERWLDWESA